MKSNTFCLLVSGIALACLAPASFADYDLLIVAPREFSEALEPLQQHKSENGIPARIRTLEEIYYAYRGGEYHDNPERIKRAIYDEWVSDQIRYVILVGDGTKFPFRFTFGDIWDKGDDRLWDPTDYYYADVANDSGGFNDWDWNDNDVFGELYVEHVNQDEIDFHPEVAVGRIPAGNLEEVRNFVAKVIRHEYRSPGGNAWFRNAVYSSTEDPPWESPSMTAIFDNIEASLSAADARFSHERYIAAEATFGNLKTSFEAGTGFLFHHGHGSTSEFQHEVLTTGKARDDISYDLYKHPIMFASSCSTARLSPYIPHRAYWARGGYEHSIPKGTVGFANPADVPEPDPIQFDPATDTHYGFTNNIARELIVGSEGGAIAYMGCVQTGENEGLILGRGFFEAYRRDFTFPEQIHLGDMWKGAIAHFAGIFDLHRYDHDTSSDDDEWRVRATFHTPLRFTMFGDPSLRVGGYSWDLEDDTPPVTILGIDPGRFYNDELVVELDATDALSGVHSTEINVRNRAGGEWEMIDGKSYAFDSIPSDAISRFTFSYRSVDIMENEEEWNSTILMFDPVLPEPVSISLDGAPSALLGFHYSGEITIGLESSDDDAGIERIDYVISRDTGAVIPETFDWGSIDNPSSSPGSFSRSFTFDHSGRFQIVALAVDRAGNRSISRTSQFTIRLLDRREWLSELVDILVGQHAFEMAPELGIPFDPSSMDLEIDLPGTGWTRVARDEIAKDGWAFQWNTQKFQDGTYESRAVARQGLKEQVVPLGSWGVMNRSVFSYAFSLAAGSEVADRGELVPYSISFDNKGADVLTGAEIIFDVGNGQYDLENLKILDGGSPKKIDGRTVIQWSGPSIKQGQKWTVRFEAAAASVRSGEHATGFAYFRCNQIPVVASDDPSTTGEFKDPVKVLVMANDGVIEGTVRDKTLLQPLAEISLGLDGTRKGETDAKGHFRFEVVPAGTHQITALGGDLYLRSTASVEVDGDTVRADILLAHADLSPPKVYLTGSFHDHVAQGSATFSGIAVDNKGGSGVAKVEIGIVRLSDGQFWNGRNWQEGAIIFAATGTDKWSYSLPSLEYNPLDTYGLHLRALDKIGNAGLMEAESRPPVPTGLAATPDGKQMVLSWNQVPGHGFLVEVSDRSDFQNRIVYDYVDDNRLVLTRSLPDGRYYWRLVTTAGANLLSESSRSAQFTIGSPPEELRIIEVSRNPVTAHVGLNWNTSIENGVIEFSADLVNWKTLASKVTGVGWIGAVPGSADEIYLRVRNGE